MPTGPEMQALLHAQRQVEIEKRQAAESRYPTLTFDGYLGGAGIDARHCDPRPTPYGFNLNVPLFTGGTHRRAARARRSGTA